MARKYSSTAALTTLSAGITGLSTTMQVASTSGYPASTPFTLVVDPGVISEEIVEVTGVAGLTLTIVRGVDGSAASAHSAGAEVRHMATARDFREPQEHIDATAAHGASGAVVGTTSAQTLSNKTLSNPVLSGTLTGGTVNPAVLQVNTIPAVTTTGVQTLENKTLTAPTLNAPSINGGIADFGDLKEDGVPVVTTSAVQTLTNKTITGGTVNPTQLQQAGVPAVTTTAAQTLTNKTLTSPTINDPVLTRASKTLMPRIQCTSTTRPTGVAEGQEIYETDTKQVYTWTGTATGWSQFPLKHYGWYWGGNLYNWAIPNGNWNLAPGARARVQVVKGHLYQMRAAFGVINAAQVYNVVWRASMWVDGGMIGEVGGWASDLVANGSGVHRYPTNFTQHWAAPNTGEVVLQTLFAAGAINGLAVYTEFRSPYTEFTDLGPVEIANAVVF